MAGKRQSRVVAAVVSSSLAAAAGAVRADVISPHADAVNVTIYRDGELDLTQTEPDPYDTSGLALIVERRTVDLPAGRSRVRFQGVADAVIPESAAVGGLPGAVVERNYDYDLLGPSSLLARSVGETVRLVRTNSKTGKETSESGILRSGPIGMLIDFGEGHVEALHCSGGPERLVFDHPPADLAERPTLSVVADAPHAGRYTVALSYLTVRMNWQADYIARLSPDGRTLNLSGWITLANHTTMSFEHAPTAVVAGRLSRVDVELPNTGLPIVQPTCWALGDPHHLLSYERARRLASSGEMQAVPIAISAYTSAKADLVGEVIVTGARRAIESQLGDYKLYTLPEPTTVAALQTKQVAFLELPAVRFETVYRYEVNNSDRSQTDGADAEAMPGAVVLKFENKPGEGLGRALPAGRVTVLAPAGPHTPPLLVGEPAIERDTPVGERFELTLGDATDVAFAQQVTSARESGHHGHWRATISYRVLATNAGGRAATVEIRHPRDELSGFRVVSESARHGLRAGDPLWRLSVPASGERELTYTVTYDE